MTDRLMSDEEAAALEREHGITYVAWECYARWLARYRIRFPDDMRDDVDLTAVYAEQPDLFDGEGDRCQTA